MYNSLTNLTITELHEQAMTKYNQAINLLVSVRQSLHTLDSTSLIIEYMKLGEFAVSLTPLLGVLNAYHDLAGTVTSKKENNISAEDCKLIEEARVSITHVLTNIDRQTILAQQYIKITKENI